jgi:phenylpropionate dioxygenase-like ring-hydroxylating dioxygenase large terminal subunit
VRLAKEAGQAMPMFAAESEGQLRKLNCGSYDIATSAPRLIENFLEMAHFSFVHDGWLGSPDATAIHDY